MRNTYNWLLSVAVFLHSCSPASSSLITEPLSEKSKSDIHYYDRDNYVFTVGREFLYEVKMISNYSEIKIPTEYIILTFLGGTEPFNRIDSDYNQTVIQYDYLSATRQRLFHTKTGVIDNDSNIWLHPHREGALGLLQLSAFPFASCTPLCDRATLLSR